MSWRDQLRPASVDGLQFYVQSTSLEFGRRKQINEFPQSDEATGNDFGKKARAHHIEAFLVGADVFTQRDELIAVLEKSGQRVLVHPYFGRLIVDILDDCRCEHSTAKGGYVKITFTAVVTKLRSAVIAEDTTATTLSALNAAGDASKKRFAKLFKLLEKPGYLVKNAMGVMGKGLDSLRGINSQLSALQTPFNDAAAMLNDMQNELATLIRQPLALADSIGNVGRQLMATGNKVDAALSGYKRNKNDMQAIAAVPDTTPHRQQEARNQQALTALINEQVLIGALISVTRATAAEQVDVSVSPFNSYEHAMAVKAEFMAALDAQSANADDDLYNALSASKAAFARHIERHGVTLQRVVAHQQTSTQPALVIAYRLYGDALRDNDIISRNNIKHPGFVPPGPLEVLNA